MTNSDIPFPDFDKSKRYSLRPAIPDRVSTDDRSPHQWHHSMKLGVRLNGVDRPKDVVEFCVSEGWIRVYARRPDGKLRVERGRVVCVKLRGVVEPYWRE